MKTILSIIFGVATLTRNIPHAQAAPEVNRITYLPGLDNSSFPLFPMYSGYINVNLDPTNQQELFYWHVQSNNTPNNDPLVFWNTGGPGCSSLYALLTEHGPLSINPDGKTLSLNPYSWNLAGSNMVYVESPVCVGFSYSVTNNCTTGDDIAAQSMYLFIKNFINEYPEYNNRPVYLSGESYSGHYTLQISYLLYTNPLPNVNFQGFLVGNPSLDGYYDSQNYWQFMSLHSLAATEEYNDAYTICNGSFTGNLSPACSQALSTIRSNIPYTNPYNIYAPCNGPPSLDGSCFTMQNVLSELSARGEMYGTSIESKSQTVVPCMNVTPGVVYLNTPEVQTALHVAPQSQIHAWDVCSSYVNYTQYAATVVPIYQTLKDKVDILVYSGDVDSCVPYLGTEAAVDSFGWEVDTPYIRWWIQDQNGLPQRAGFLRKYKSSTNHVAAYATISGAGHMSPGKEIGKPEAAFTLFQGFINKGSWPITPPAAPSSPPKK